MLNFNLYHDLVRPLFSLFPILYVLLISISVYKSIIPTLKIKKAFDNGLEEKLAKKIPIDAYKIEFQKDKIYFTLADGQLFWFTFNKMDYANLPNIRYTKAMAKEYKKRFLAGQKAKIYKSTSSIEGGYVTTGYNTTRTSDGYHTEEARSYVPGSTTVLGYEIINYDVKRAASPKIQPPKNKW